VKEAARQAMAWDNHTSDELVITVNVSTVQMNDPQFYQRVRDQVRVLGNSQHKVRLAMEITESQMIQNLDRSIRLLEDIRALGISIVIDDFGTGYSSLSYLHRLPVDILKIDKSFTESIDTRSKERMIVEGIIALAGTLQLRTIAEGIEREAQMDIVKKMGGTFAQGYLIDRALSAADVEHKWLHAAI
jgi:EAL domain-containing protein (putative c-di-GMP-specific phosphodiesterase class I)